MSHISELVTESQSDYGSNFQNNNSFEEIDKILNIVNSNNEAEEVLDRRQTLA